MARPDEERSPVEVANAYIAQEWAVLPPRGSVVSIPMFHCNVKVVRAEIIQATERGFTAGDVMLVLERCDGEWQGGRVYGSPDDIAEVVSVPEDAPPAELWWRRPNKHSERP